MMQTKQGQYLWIKQRLDKYNISTTFPLQMMPLLQSLLSRLDGEATKINNFSYERLKASQNQVKEIQLTSKLIPDALKMQISRVTQQNNQLHMDIITLKQELQSVKHFIDKLAIQKSDNRTQIEHIIAFKKEKQDEMREQLKLIKYKYNELMDFIHNNDSLERMYLKRLLNHKKFEIKQEDSLLRQAQTVGKIRGSERKSDSRQDLNSRITFNAKNSSQRHKQTRSRINQTLQQGHRRQSSNKIYENDIVQKLKEKLVNREKQILRLQSITTFNGPDLNKVLTQFNHSMQKTKRSEINQRLEHLESQNQKLIKDLKNAKNNAGRYQALRDQVDKCHQLIKNLKEQNKNIKRSLKENNFNLQKDKIESKRSVVVFGSQNSQMKLIKFEDDLKIETLKKKVQFYEKQFGLGSKQEQHQTFLNPPTKVQQKKLKKKSIKTKKAVQSEPQRLTYQEHIKFSENKTQEKQKSKKTIKKKLQNKSKVKKPKDISQIPEQSEQESVQDNERQQQQIISSFQQNQQAPQFHHSYEIKKSQQRVQSQSQSQQSQQNDEQGNHAKEKDDTLADQYLQTINELSAKCLQLKQELQSKNNAIHGMEQIINRFIQKQKLNQTQSKQTKNTHIQNQQQPHIKEISKLKKQVQSLSALLNESQFQKQELRRQFIQMQKLYKQIPQITVQQTISTYKTKISQLQKLIQQKDNKIDQMREDHTQIQDKLLKSLDMIRRLNDEIEVLTKQKQGLIKEFQLNSSRLDEAAQLLKKQRQKHSTTIELSELQKDEIIMLRKNLVNAQSKIDELQNYILAMQNNQEQVAYDEDYN